LINDTPFLITLGLLKALKAVDAYFYNPNLKAQILRAAQTRLLWVDALCINQADPDEKTQQVRRMDKIYSKANHVLVWLGDDYENSEVCLKVFRWLEAKYLMKDMPKDVEPGILETIRYDSAMSAQTLKTECNISDLDLSQIYDLTMRLLEIPWNDQVDLSEDEHRALIKASQVSRGAFGPNKPCWTAFLSLMQRQWFERLWTLQEIQLAQNASLLCGKGSVDWHFFKLVRNSYYTWGWQGILYGPSNVRGSSSYQDGFIEGYHWDLFVSPFQGFATLRQLLSNTESRRAKDPRDYVFGLLGLLDVQLRFELEATYDSSISVVYSGFVKLVCDKSPDSNILCELLERFQFCPRHPSTDLPTWCPDFSGKLPHGFGPLYGWQHWPRVSTEVVDASKVVPDRVAIHEGECQISTIQLDEVILGVQGTPPLTLFEAMSTNGQLSYRADGCQEWCLSMLRLLSFWGWPEAKRGNDEPLHRLFADDAFPSDTTFVQLLIDGAQDRISTAGGEEAEDAMKLLLNLCVGRYFFVTESNLLGFSTAPVGAGDHVCYLQGGLYLHILSAGLDHYLSTACVPELMGDGLTELAKRADSWTRVTLH